MSEHTLYGHPVVAVLKPGDIVVLECEKPVHVEQMSAMRAMLEEWCNKNGVKVLLLPHPIRVARVEVVEEKKE